MEHALVYFQDHPHNFCLCSQRYEVQKLRSATYGELLKIYFLSGREARNRPLSGNLNSPIS